jgi:hypothetical protein
MVMGFKNAPQQRVMTKILYEFRNKGVEVYMDDRIVHAKTKDALRVNTKKNRKMKL